MSSTMNVDRPAVANTSSTSDPRLNKGAQRPQTSSSQKLRLNPPGNVSSRSEHSPSLPAESPSDSFLQALSNFTKLQFETLSEQKEKRQLSRLIARNQRCKDYGDRVDTGNAAFHAAQSMQNRRKRKETNEINRLDESLKKRERDLKLQTQELYRQYAINRASSLPSAVTNSPQAGPSGLPQPADKKINELEAQVKSLKDEIENLRDVKGSISQLQSDRDKIPQLEAQVKQLQISKRESPGAQSSEAGIFSNMQSQLEEHKKHTEEQLQRSYSSFQKHSETIQILSGHKHAIEIWKKNIEEGSVRLPLSAMPTQLSSLPQDVKQIQLKADQAYGKATSIHEQIPSLVQQRVDTAMSNHSQSYAHLKTLVDDLSSVRFPRLEEHIKLLEQYHAASQNNESEIRNLNTRLDESKRAFESIKSQISSKQRDHSDEQVGSSGNIPSMLSDRIDAIQTAIGSLEARYNNINTEAIYRKIAQALADTCPSLPKLLKDFEAFEKKISAEMQFINNQMKQLDAPALEREITGKINGALSRQYADLKEAQESQSNDLTKQVENLKEAQKSQSNSLTKQLEDLHELKSDFDSQQKAFAQFVNDYREDNPKTSEDNGEVSEELSEELKKITRDFDERTRAQIAQVEELQSSVQTWTQSLASLEPLEDIPLKLNALGSVEGIKSMCKQMQDMQDVCALLQSLNDDIGSLSRRMDDYMETMAKGASKPLSVNNTINGLLTTTGSNSNNTGLPPDPSLLEDRPQVESSLEEMDRAEIAANNVPNEVTNSPMNTDGDQPGPLEATDCETSSPGMQIKGLSTSTPKSSKKRRRQMVLSDDEYQSQTSSMVSTPLSPPPRASKKSKKSKRK